MPKRQNEAKEAAPGKDSEWARTSVANLYRYKSSGTYFARVRVSGKLFCKSLKTDVFNVAKMRLADFIKEKREEMGARSRVKAGKMSLGDALKVLRQRLDDNPDLKEGAKVYRLKCIKALLKSWPGLEDINVNQISKEDCLTWANEFAKNYSPSVYNNTVGTLRLVLAIAIEKGARATNPANFITKRRINQKILKLPEPDVFQKFVSEMETGGGWCSQECADLVSFLAYGGFRKTEAANITWSDCDFARRQITVRMTKTGEPRTVPMVPEMRDLLKGLRAQRPDESLDKHSHRGWWFPCSKSASYGSDVIFATHKPQIWAV